MGLPRTFPMLAPVILMQMLIISYFESLAASELSLLRISWMFLRNHCFMAPFLFPGGSTGPPGPRGFLANDRMRALARLCFGFGWLLAWLALAWLLALVLVWLDVVWICVDLD